MADEKIIIVPELVLTEERELVICYWCEKQVPPKYWLWEWWACQRCFEEIVNGLGGKTDG